jgi:DNA polymerase-4
MDAFYASIEQREDPKLIGRPIVVGGRPDSRGVVAAASYEARQFGIRSAMSCAEAYRRCPQAAFLKPRFELYKRVSRHIRGILKRVTTVVEPLSLDEAYLDLTAVAIGYGSAQERIRQTLRSIHSETGLTASAGVAPNKFLAKVASDMNKPFGIFVLKPAAVQTFLKTLPVNKIPGVGKVARAKLTSMGITYAAQIRTVEEAKLREVFGKFGSRLYELAVGQDERPVEVHTERKSIGVENTFDVNITSYDEKIIALEQLLVELLKRCGRNSNFTPASLTLKIKSVTFQQYTRSISLPAALELNFDSLITLVRELLLKGPDLHEEVRLLGLSFHQTSSRPHGESKQMRLL